MSKLVVDGLGKLFSDKVTVPHCVRFFPRCFHLAVGHTDSEDWLQTIILKKI